MWWQKVLEGLGSLVAGLAGNVFRFYVETRVGSTRTLFFLNPIFANNLDTDGSGGADLSISIVPTVGLPPDGLTITFQRIGSGVPGLSALVYISLDEGIYPVGTPPARMQFAFFGFERGPGQIPPQEVKLFLRQQTAAASTNLTTRLSITNGQGPVLIRGGLMTSPVQIEQAGNIPLGGNSIRAGNLAFATELTDARLSLAAPSGGTLSIAPPLEVQVGSAATTTVRYTAPSVLALSADVASRAQTSSQMRFSTALMPRQLDVALSDTEAVVQPNAPLTADVRGVGLPLPAPFTSATARLAIPALPLRIAWGPAPVVIDVGLQPGTAGTLAASLNAQLLAGAQAIESLGPPPQPRQALVMEYREQQELWAAVNALGGARLTRQQTGTATSAAASLTLVNPLSNDSPLVPPRSMRLTAWTANRLTADVRASQLEASQPQGNSGTLSGSVDLDTGTVRGEISGRLRHLRALYDDGTARNEAWTVATPPTLRFSYENTDRIRFLLTPEAAMAVTADRVALGPAGGMGDFARLFARLLVNAPVTGSYGLIPRQPSVNGTVTASSTATVHQDAAGTAFTPDLVGMSLRYESGTNQGQTRQITAVGPGELRTVEFPFPPSAGDAFVVVATDARLDAGGNLVRASTRRGISATVSAGRARDQRLATRIHPQVVQQTSRRWIPFASSLGPDERDAVAARIEGILGVTLPPPILAGQGWLAADVELDPARPRRSVRYAENRRWILPESVREAITQAVPSTARPVPRVRALLADVPDSIIIRQNISGGAESYSLTRSGGGDQGWVWALIQQPRCCNGGFAGIGVISLNITRLPQRLGLILAENLADVRRVTPPGDVMWTPSSGWLPPSSQAITIGGSDLRVERVVYASFWPGRTSRSDGSTQSYPTRNEDEWNLITATFAHLHDTGAGEQRLTIWPLDGTDWDDPDRNSGIGIEAVGLNADLDLDRYRALLPPQIRGYFSIPWTKTTEIQLDMYTGAWLLSGGLAPDYERPNEDMGFWFLRAINKIPGIGDAYFGNTSGNINGRQRRFP